MTKVMTGFAFRYRIERTADGVDLFRDSMLHGDVRATDFLGHFGDAEEAHAEAMSRLR